MSQQKSPHEEFIMTFIVVGLVWGISAIIWHFFHQQLTEVLRWIRVLELWICKLFVGDDYTVSIPYVGDQTVGMWRKWLPGAAIEDIGDQEISVMTQVAVPPLRPLFIGIMIVMGLWVTFFGYGTQYRRRMNLEMLIREQARAFPVISPFVNFDPRKLPFRVPGQNVPSTLPLFAEALTPEEWIAYNEIPMTNGVPDPGKMHQALAKQLGKRWQGPLALPIHAQGLFAAFALRAARKRKESANLLGEMAMAWSADKGFRPPTKLKMQIRKVIKDAKLGGALAKVADLHAYETTAMIRSLARAREQGGVVAPAEFVWLRAHDRNLWYALQNLGRKSYHAEASGSLVHFTNELIASQKIPTPRFDDVLKAFEVYLKSGAAREVPQLDKSAGNVQYWKK